MASKLKKLSLSSIDLCGRGANQEADFCLHKSAESPAEAEVNIFKRFIAWLRENPTEAENEPTDTIEKDYTTFDQINNNRESAEKLWRYTDALNCSIRSIHEDNELDRDAKASMMLTSLRQFTDAMEELIAILAGTAPEKHEPTMAAKSAPSVEEIDDDPYDTIEEVFP